MVLGRKYRATNSREFRGRIWAHRNLRDDSSGISGALPRNLFPRISGRQLSPGNSRVVPVRIYMRIP
jgi:hypothetical protein